MPCIIKDLHDFVINDGNRTNMMTLCGLKKSMRVAFQNVGKILTGI